MVYLVKIIIIELALMIAMYCKKNSEVKEGKLSKAVSWILFWFIAFVFLCAKM